MTVSYNSALKSARMQAVIAAIDANASPGSIEIGTAGMGQVLVTITLSKPSFAESGGMITMLGTPKSGISSSGGTAVAARIKDGGGNVIVSGLTVGTAASDVILGSVSLSLNQPVDLNSGTISHAP